MQLHAWDLPLDFHPVQSRPSLRKVISARAVARGMATVPANRGSRTAVVFVPGGVNPAAITYGELLSALKDSVHPVLKDHELYKGNAPPPGWDLGTEVEAINMTADSAGFSTFHLVGYSGGGAISLAFVLAYGERLRSLALIEPAWIGKSGWTPEEIRYWANEERNSSLAGPDFLREFMRIGLKPGVPLPQPQGPMPDWMEKRPAGLRAFMAAFKEGDLDHSRLRKFGRPVYVAYGDQSAVVEEIKARRLSKIFPDCRVEVYQGTHHFAPPQRLQPERFAASMRELWMRGDAAMNKK